MRSREHKSKRGWWWLLVLAATTGLITYSAWPRPVEIKAVQATEGALELSLSSTGIVEGDLVDVSPRITARISGLYAEEGDEVVAGQTLGKLENADILAEEVRLTAAVRSAHQTAGAAQVSAGADRSQLDAAIQQAKASVAAANQRLKELEAGFQKEDIEQQRAILDQAKATATDARRRYARLQELYKAGAVSAQDTDSGKMALDGACAVVQAQEQALRKLESGPRKETIAASRAELNALQAAEKQAEAALGTADVSRYQAAAAQANLAQAQAAVRGVEVQLTYTTITSPVQGIVVRRHKEVGETAAPLDPIYTLVDPARTWVTAEVDEEDASALAVGQDIGITLDAYPGQTIKGRVTRVSPVAEPKEIGRIRAKIVRARIEFRKGGIRLKPGMEVNINGSLPARQHTVLVPNDAVLRIDGEDTVFVLDDVATKRKVKVGMSNFDFTQILSGLREGDTVAVSNLGKLKGGTKFRVVR